MLKLYRCNLTEAPHTRPYCRCRGLPATRNTAKCRTFEEQGKYGRFRSKRVLSKTSGLNGRARRCHDRTPRQSPWAYPMSIYEQVLTFIHRPEDKSFERVAREVFRHQFETVPAYRRYCEGLGADPDSVRSVDEIPAVSNVAFKYAELASEGAADAPGAAIFMTSGTTQ